MAIIENGTGNSMVAAKVDTEYRLWTQAVVEEEAKHISSSDGEYYSLCNGAGHLNAEGWLLYLQNNSQDKRIHIQSIYVNSTEPGLWHIGKNGVYGSGGTVVQPINLNFSVTNVPPCTAYYGNPLTMSTQPIVSFGGTTEKYIKFTETLGGSVVLGNGNTFSLKFKWIGTAGIVAMGIQFYYKKIIT